MYTIFFISFLITLALHVLFAPIIRSTTAAYCHRFFMVLCFIPLEQVLVWDSFTLEHGQLQTHVVKKEIKNIVYI
jgi:hypothetical protein